MAFRSSKKNKVIVVFITCPNRTIANRVASAVLKKRLAACVNIISNVSSLFWWQGKIGRSSERLLIIKTTAAAFKSLKKIVLSVHSYQVPEIIALPVSSGHAPYLDWVRTTTQAQSL